MIKAKEKPMKTGMREIKFRGKRIDNGEWVYGHYFLGVPSPLDENKQRHYIAPPLGLGEEVDPATVGQFTGLKDKNGQEIYEDDIAKVKISTFIDDAISNEEEIFELVKPVIYRGCAFVVDISELGTEIDYELIENFCGNVGEEFGHSFEVIGNIYDNPELLEGTLIEGTGNQDEGDSWEERQGDHDD